MPGVLLLGLRSSAGQSARPQAFGEAFWSQRARHRSAIHKDSQWRARATEKSRSDFRPGLRFSESRNAAMHDLSRAAESLSRFSRDQALRLLRLAAVRTRAAGRPQRDAAGADHFSQRRRGTEPLAVASGSYSRLIWAGLWIMKVF